MMPKLDIDDENYNFFVQESLDLLQCLESGILTLRQEHSINKIHSLMRIAHSIKGGSACVGLTGIQTLAHHLENTFKVLYQENIEVDQELEELLLQAYDSLRSPLLAQIQTGECDTDADHEKLKQICAQIEANLGANLAEETESKAAETDEDIAQVLFAEDVARGLECWEMLLSNPQMPELVEKLKIQAEVFASIGQFLNLPSFVAIAQTTISALQINPQAVKTIGKLAAKDFRAIQTAVLAGSRSPNIKPCSELVNLAKCASQNATNVNENVPPEAEKEPNPKLGVRVDLERLELLNNLVGDLVTQESSFILQQQQQKEIVETISQRLNRLNKLTRNYLSRGAAKHRQLPIALEHTVAEEIAHLQAALQDIIVAQQQVQQIIKKRQQTLKQLQTNLLHARMLPIGNLLNRFSRMVRDLAVKNHKQINLQLVGMNTLIDKAILEKLYDPLIHLVRNAVDHGIETPSVRQANGKSATGTITIRAYHRGNYTYIELQDDGQGIDEEKIVRRAIALNWLSSSEAETLPKNRLYEYLFAPGFSTAAKVSELSGRGVGLEVVRLQVNGLKGDISVTSCREKGTKFTLRLPFTLTITKLLVFGVDAKILAIPVDSLVAIAAVTEPQIITDGEQQYYSYQGQIVPVYSHFLPSAYSYPCTPPEKKQYKGSCPWQEAGKAFLLLISGKNQIIALKIDRILIEQDLAIKPFGDAIAPPPYLYGCTILGNGNLVPVIDGTELAGWLQQHKPIQTHPI
ncbi:chemotaxis protein CheA [Microseira sp. BLCC-F43]|uniref:chemotaxis protein CheA n=1 Tax=Microseira sp. BLCC-F43 TaxID=3153602 RepID=UPI0035B94962